MAPHRVSKGGSYRFDRRFKGVGRIWRASGTTKAATFRRLNVMLTELYEDGYLDILKAIKDDRLTAQEVYQAKRAGRLSYLVADMLVERPLWQEVEAWVPHSAAAPASRKRYEVSMAALRAYGPLGEDAKVSALADLDWRALRQTWPNSAADWNRMRAAVSRFLTMHLGDKYHPFRREVVGAIPRAKEPRAPMPDITPEVFWQIIDHVPEPLQAPFVAIAAMGLRPGEYLALEEHHLMPHTRSVRVPGTKTAGSADTVRLGPHAWAWVQRAVPSPIEYDQLYRTFKAAAEAAGHPDLLPRHLRNLHGMMLSDAGTPEAKIQTALRHATPSMTRRYVLQRSRGETARTVDEVLFPSPVRLVDDDETGTGG